MFFTIRNNPLYWWHYSLLQIYFISYYYSHCRFLYISLVLHIFSHYLTLTHLCLYAWKELTVYHIYLFASCFLCNLTYLSFNRISWPFIYLMWCINILRFSSMTLLIILICPIWSLYPLSSSLLSSGIGSLFFSVHCIFFIDLLIVHLFNDYFIISYYWHIINSSQLYYL